MDLDETLKGIQEAVSGRFKKAERVLSFEEYLEEVRLQPALHLRTSPQYLLEAFDYFGKRAGSRVGQEVDRFELFDLPAEEGADPLTGQERAQNELYRYVQNFARRGKTDKMLLLHGPNGSGKTTLVESIFRALETFSKTREGVLYSFKWVFTDRDGKLERIGFDPSVIGEELAEESGSCAHLDDREISSRIGCELRDSPLFLIPAQQRGEFIRTVLAERPPERYPDLCWDYYERGELCQKCKRIFDSLLVAYGGDWRRVMRHIQVVRFPISKRYRSAAVSIEPQGNIDANTRAIVGEQAYSIPPVLKNVSLYEPVGDIIDANRGLLEYSDFLKRPLEANKYLLTTIERGTVNLSGCMAFLDQSIVATANEKQLSMFKRNPDFSSFKGRMELIPIPYLLRYSSEVELYRRQIRSYAKGRHVTPHSSKIAALWAVLTRLRKPDGDNYEDSLGDIVSTLSPLEKAKFYDSGETPSRLTEDERKVLRAGILSVRNEFEESEGEFEGIWGAEYEGRRGVSPREMLMVMARAAVSRRHSCLTPMAVFGELADLVKESSIYDFLRLEPMGSYRNPVELLEEVRAEYLRWVTDEVYDSISLIDEAEYDRVFLAYFQNVKAFDAKEQVFKPETDSYAQPDESLLESIETQVGISDPPAEWRSNIMLRIAAWSLDHPGEALDYEALFPDIYSALRANFYSERTRLLTLIEKDILKFGSDEFELLSDTEKAQVTGALGKMESEHGYCQTCARDVIAYVLRERARIEAEKATA